MRLALVIALLAAAPVRADKKTIEANERVLCPDRQSGALRTRRRCTDSDRIPNPFRMAFRAQKASEASR